MSTRSAIIKKTENGYTGIYCHSDGDIHGVGRILLDHYTTNDQVDDLIALGNLSVLGERLAPVGPHSFDKPERGTTIAYDRDRESGDWNAHMQPGDNDAYTAATLAEVVEAIDHQFYYVHANGAWTVNGGSLRAALAAGELISDDARQTPEAITRATQSREVLHRLHRRLIAPDLDLTGDALDQRAGDCPLLAFRF